MSHEIFWAAIWALCHGAGLAIMLVLRHRSSRQVRVAEQWLLRAAPEDAEEAADLVILTRDRHRRNNALVVVAAGYLLLGLLVLSYTVVPWLPFDTYRTINRAILTVGEAIWIGSAWLSVAVGDRLANAHAREAPRGRRTT